MAPVLGQAAGGVPGVSAAAPAGATVTGVAAGPASLAQVPAGMGAAGVPGTGTAGGAGAAAGGAAPPPQAVSVLASAERAKNMPLVRAFNPALWYLTLFQGLGSSAPTTCRWCCALNAALAVLSAGAAPAGAVPA